MLGSREGLQNALFYTKARKKKEVPRGTSHFKELITKPILLKNHVMIFRRV